MNLELKMSLYGPRQAGMLWGSVIDNKLKVWEFTTTQFDKSLYFLNKGDSFIILLIVVDDMILRLKQHTSIEMVKINYKKDVRREVIWPVEVVYRLAAPSKLGWNLRRSKTVRKMPSYTLRTRTLQPSSETVISKRGFDGPFANRAAALVIPITHFPSNNGRFIIY